MDLSAIQAAISSLRAATDISKAIVDLKVSTEIQGKIIELQNALMEAQNSALAATTAQFELQETVRKLEERIKKANDWEAQRVRYALTTPWDGPAQVYALKKSRAEGEAAHYLCANCFHQENRVILNPAKRNSWIVMSCPNCKASLETGYRGIPAPLYAEGHSNG